MCDPLALSRAPPAPIWQSRRRPAARNRPNPTASTGTVRVELARVSAPCVGLLLLGVCVPLPGAKVDERTDRGWAAFGCGTTMPDDDRDVWSRTATFPAWKGRMIGSLSGTGERIEELWLFYFDDDVVSPALLSHCSAPVRGRRRCTVAGRTLRAEQCAGVGWRLSLPTERTGSPDDWCERYGSLLRSARVRPTAQANP